jgi:hypothetical protein
LSSIAGSYSFASSFQIPNKYDYTKSTNDNYRNPDVTDIHGEFTAFREMMDYSYHCNYVKERQMWQDDAIRAVVSRTGTQARPWLSERNQTFACLLIFLSILSMSIPTSAHANYFDHCD